MSDENMKNTTQMSIEQRDELIEVLTSLEELTKKQTSLKFTLLKGAVYGLGTVIGATVLISVISYLAVQLLGNEIADEQMIETSIKELVEPL